MRSHRHGKIEPYPHPAFLAFGEMRRSRLHVLSIIHSAIPSKIVFLRLLGGLPFEWPNGPEIGRRFASPPAGCRNEYLVLKLAKHPIKLRFSIASGQIEALNKAFDGH